MANQNPASAAKFTHANIEKSVPLLLMLTFLVISLGGIVEIVPLFTIQSTVQKVGNIRPYTPLELLGRDIYIREGCYLCHSQMIRSFRDESQRYGHYSIAAESMYDHPFQWGSKRIGPDLARVGGRYSNAWHMAHLTDPRAVVPQSVMPPYAFLKDDALETADIDERLKTLAIEGVPYDNRMEIAAQSDILAQAGLGGDADALAKRYPGAKVASALVSPGKLTEMDALIAYLQVLGTMVDFNAAGEPVDTVTP